MGVRVTVRETIESSRIAAHNKTYFIFICNSWINKFIRLLKLLSIIGTTAEITNSILINNHYWNKHTRYVKTKITVSKFDAKRYKAIQRDSVQARAKSSRYGPGTAEAAFRDRSVINLAHEVIMLL